MASELTKGGTSGAVKYPRPNFDSPRLAPNSGNAQKYGPPNFESDMNDGPDTSVTYPVPNFPNR